MIALLVVSAVAAVEAVVIVWGRAKFVAERAKTVAWLESLPGKAEVAVKREAEVLVADIKKKI
jgi:hypothetical protein